MAEDESGETLSGKKCLVTGSSGFIGSHRIVFAVMVAVGTGENKNEGMVKPI